MDVQAIISSLRSEMPPLVTRKLISKMTGGYLAPGTLANLDSLGKGPRGVRAGKSVIYTRDDFLRWFEQRIKNGVDGDAA